MNDKIVTPDFNKKSEIVTKVFNTLCENNAPMNSRVFLREFLYSLKCILNNNTVEKNDNENNKVIIGFHDYSTGIQYISAFVPDTRTISVFTGQPLYTFLNTANNMNESFASVIYVYMKENKNYDIESFTIPNEDFTFTFKEFIQEMFDQLQCIINSIPPVRIK